jgi:hypothetical protein
MTRAHPLGSLWEAQLLLQSLSSNSVQKPCWYSKTCFLFPESFTLGLSYPSSLKLASPVSCHIKLWTEVSDLRHVRHSRVRLHTCAFWLLWLNFQIEFAVCCVMGQPVLLTALILGPQDWKSVCKHYKPGIPDSKWRKSLHCSQSLSQPPVTLHMEIDDYSQYKVNGFADRCCTREFFLKEASYCYPRLSSSVSYFPKLSCLSFLIFWSHIDFIKIEFKGRIVKDLQTEL